MPVCLTKVSLLEELGAVSWIQPKRIFLSFLNFQKLWDSSPPFISRPFVSLMCPKLCPRGSLYHLPPPTANQRGNKKPLVTIEDYKGPFVEPEFTKPLLYQLSYAGPRARVHNLHGFFLSLKGFIVQ